MIVCMTTFAIHGEIVKVLLTCARCGDWLVWVDRDGITNFRGQWKLDPSKGLSSCRVTCLKCKSRMDNINLKDLTRTTEISDNVLE